MVISDFHIKGIALPPFETDAPLIIDPNAVLSFPIPFKRFQAIAGRLPEILERSHAAQIQELSPCLPLYRLEPARRQIVKQILGISFYQFPIEIDRRIQYTKKRNLERNAVNP